MDPLEKLGFALAGYGCTTCIGNSGPLDEPVARAVEDHDLVVAAVLSGNRNFEGRIHPLARASYLASPPLVVAFALAGRVDIDLTREPLGIGDDGRPVFLADVWPSLGRGPSGRSARRSRPTCSGRPTRPSSTATTAGGRCRSRPATGSTGSRRRRTWPDRRSSRAFRRHRAPIADIVGARVLALLGDSVTTDHISPAGSIAAWSPAGEWLQAHGVGPLEFNSYGARRGQHEVMIRGHVRQHPVAQRARGRQGGAVHGPPAGRRGDVHLRRGRPLRGRGRAAARSSRAASTARARRVTGRPRARPCSASGPSWPRATSGSTDRTWSGWASCRSSTGRASPPRRSD